MRGLIIFPLYFPTLEGEATKLNLLV
ncbi:unnamed protein product [Cuscuta epithymum]|uniref:Uncharacterized protein n=1 Tax=Cuscuta epithymum TaxID=186058 RepID=A0AAV0GFA6_9ASTE|nr:unnamed protein product [Cuscuta epithymum]